MPGEYPWHSRKNQEEGRKYPYSGSTTPKRKLREEQISLTIPMMLSQAMSSQQILRRRNFTAISVRNLVMSMISASSLRKAVVGA